MPIFSVTDFLTTFEWCGCGGDYDPNLDTSSQEFHHLRNNVDPTPIHASCTSRVRSVCTGTTHPTPSLSDVNQIYQAPRSGGNIPLKNSDDTPTTSCSSSLDLSNHTPPKIPNPKPFSKGSKGKTRVSSGSSKEEKLEKHGLRSSSVASSKSPVVTTSKPAVLVTPEQAPPELLRVPSVASSPEESSLDSSAEKRKRGPGSSRKKATPKTPAPQPDSPPTSFGSLKSHSSMQSQVKKKKRRERRAEPKVKTYVELTDKDVLLGRGGGSNNHPGNQAYLQHVRARQKLYQTLEHASEKTAFSQAVVDLVKDRGGRFLKRDGKGGPWYVVTDVVARTKASQALREVHTSESRLPYEPVGNPGGQMGISTEQESICSDALVAVAREADLLDESGPTPEIILPMDEDPTSDQYGRFCFDPPCRASGGLLDDEPRIGSPQTFSYSLVSNHMPKPKNISGGAGRVSSDSMKNQKPKKHMPKNSLVASSKSSPEVLKHRPHNLTSKKAVSAHKHEQKPPPKTQAKRNRRVKPEGRIPVEKTHKDVLLGRGFCSYHHPGNKAYLKHVQGQRKLYQALERASARTAASQAVVAWVKGRGGRFLERDEEGKYWYEATDVTARVKASQVLREDHTPEGRARKKSRSKNAKKPR